MIRSRRLALASIVVVLGLSACGDPSSTAPAAEQPKVIQLANGHFAAAPEAAPAAATASGAAVDSKMAVFGPTEFIYDGALPALDAPAGSWFFPTGQQPDLGRVAKLAAALGVRGDVRTLPAEQGGGWAVGPEDYSAPVLTVGSDGMLNWWLSAPQTSISGVACGTAVSAVAPGTGTDFSGSSETTVGVAPGVATKASVGAPTTDVVVAPDATDQATNVPDCPTPQPPPGVPTKDEALAKAKQLFAAWGYDVNSYQFDDPYADEWSASVNASLLLDGMKAPIMLSVGFGENGSVTYASGYLADPQRGADYPTIGAAAALERLKNQQNQPTPYIGVDAPGVRTAIDDGTVSSGAGVATPAIAPCSDAGAATDCGPVSSEPVTVHLNSVKPDLTMQWATDNTIWLLPAYTFGTADGGMYTVLAVDDAYIQQADPATTDTTDPGTTAPGTTDPGIAPTPDTAVAVPLGAPDTAVTIP